MAHALRLAGALVALAIAVVLTVLPGPAVVFYVIAGMLLAADSAVVARWLDRGETRLRRMWRRGGKRTG